MSPTFIGRGPELCRLTAALERAATGQPAVVFVAGEAGVGKSRLVSELMSRPPRERTRFLVGGCIPLGRGELPFAPLIEAFRAVDAAVLRELAGRDPEELARLLPELSARAEGSPATSGGDQVDGGGTPGRLFELVLGLLQRLSCDGPVVLVLEDLHWADRSTLELVAYLVRNLHGNPVALVMTYRHDEIHRGHPLRAWLPELKRLDKVEALEVRRFDYEHTAEQLGAILGRSPEPTLTDAIYERGEGNPFFTEELLALVTAGDAGEMGRPLGDLPLTKVHVLSEPAQEVLRVAAAAGRRVSHGLLAQVAQVDEAALDRCLREAVDHQVIVPDADDESYTFRHGLIQEAVYADLLPGERRRLHSSLARVLTESPELGARGRASAVAEVAHHWYAGHDRSRALRAALVAATAAEDVYAYPEALGHLLRALELWASVPDAAEVAEVELVTVHERGAHMAGLIGEYERAAALVRRAIELVDPGDAHRAGLLLERLGSYCIGGGDQVGAAEAFGRAVALLPGSPPTESRAGVLVSAGNLAMLCSRYDEAAELANQALAVAREVGAGSVEARALGTLGVILSHRGDPTGGAASMRQAIATAQAANDAPNLASLYINLGHVLGVGSRLDEAVEASVEGYEVTRALGLGRQAGSYLKCNAAWALFKLGRWEEAAELWREAAAGGMRGIREMSLLLALAELDTAQGRFQSARRRLERATALSSRGWAPLFYCRELAEQRAELAVWEGNLDQARALVADGIELVAGTDDERFAGKLVMLGVRVEADQAEAVRTRRGRAHADGPARAAKGLVARARGFRPSPLDPEGCGFPEAAALAAALDGELARAQGTPAPAAWAVAAERWEELRRPYPAACSRWREGEAWLAEGNRARAAEVLQAALVVARRLKATPLVARIDELTGRGRILLDGPTGRADGPAWAAAGLTRREADVLALLATGHTNAQIADALFMSRSTASVHVSRILTKLGVSNRGQAAAAARRLGIDPGPPPP